ncbi:S41 family peptidase [Edaphobacillus lindanitolerans]|uniref:Carboxyl-terminal processing protease n=1 Tax=Edaphobacillus lindanitolerans TaxID=550447 RepID=A0A1U7PM02_9BACI|nr:S41 family peptidase [Edaphobacillus lindanitolerans]SIT69060.1 carboxyl-terminal processing protease [Edaphobacillus lindanitolerans]
MRMSRFFLLAAVAAVAGGLVYFILNGKGEGQEPISEQNPIDEAHDLIMERAVHRVGTDELVEGALRGMADVLGDPYSTYLTKEEAAEHEESLSDERVGIGAEITESRGRFIIVAPVRNSPAEKAGILPYDEIVRVDAERVEGRTMKELLRLIKGKEGTSVALTLFRPEEGRHVEVSVKRAAIPQKTVESRLIEQDGYTIGYLGLSMFGEKTAEEWETHTRKMIAGGADAFIIDVRGNPGGYLRSVGKVAGSLLRPGTVFAFMEDADGLKEPLETEAPGDKEYAEKMRRMQAVILQDKGSASASEVLSGALRDNGRAFIIGTVSFGKGTVQETMPLSNGGEMKLSTRKWLTPSGTWIHGKGIQPDLKSDQGPLYGIPSMPVDGRYRPGDYGEDVGYAQRVLGALGYEISRKDGYFDETTEKAVEKFRNDEDLQPGRAMDRDFFRSLRSRITKYQADVKNDEQLQLAIGYMKHALRTGN